MSIPFPPPFTHNVQQKPQTQNRNGEEGYIPDQYFEPMGAPPPRPGTLNASNSGVSGERRSIPSASGNKGADSSFRGGKGGVNVLEREDTYNLFAYQLEWGTITIAFFASLFSFMHGTTEEEDVAIRVWLLGIFGMFCCVVLVWITGFKRDQFRIASFVANSNLLLCGSLLPSSTCS